MNDYSTYPAGEARNRAGLYRIICGWGTKTPDSGAFSHAPQNSAIRDADIYQFLHCQLCA
jgi:hypothetical protein